MCRIDPMVVCGVLCALVLNAAADDRLPPEIDRLLDPETRKRYESHPSPDPPGRMSPEMNAINPEDLRDLKEEDLAKMSLDNPLLKYAYADVFMNSMSHLMQLRPEQELVLADMRRRGESVTPMLLKLIEENRETGIESSIIAKIEHLGTVRLEPYLEYARKLLRERTRSKIAANASGLLRRHGTKEDIELLEWMLEQGPYAVTDVTKSLKALRERLNPQPETRPERRDRPSSDVASAATSAESTKSHPHSEDFTSSRTRPWVIGGLILAVLLGVYRLTRKAFRGPQS